MAIIIFIEVLFLIAGIPEIKGYYQVHQLDAFDLNDDGIFQEHEITPEVKSLMQSIFNDTGRAFAPIIGFIFAVFYSGLFYWSLTIYNWLRQKFKGYEPSKQPGTTR